MIVAGSDGVSRLGLGLEIRLETHFCESRSRSGRFQVSRLWILQRNGLLKFLSIKYFCLLYLQVRNNQNMSEKMPEFWKNSSQKHGRLQKRFHGGQTWYFAYPFHIADDTMPVQVCKTLYSFYTKTKMPPATQRCNEGGQEGTIPRAPNHYGGAMKSQQCHKYFLQYRTFASERSQIRTGAPNLLLEPEAI